jgi:hypothetical protein
MLIQEHGKNLKVCQWSTVETLGERWVSRDGIGER